MKSKIYPYIAIAGTIGSGKTTAAKLIAKTLHHHLLEEQFARNTFLPKFYADMPRWAFHSQTFFLMEKTRQMLDIGRVLNLFQDPRNNWRKRYSGIVQDTPIEQDVFSYAKAQYILGNIDEASWQLYQKIYTSHAHSFVRPDAILFLETSIATLQKRIKKRSRTFEESIPKQYIELLDMLNHEWIRKETQIPIISIATDDLDIASKAKDKHQFLARVQKALRV